MAGTRHQAAGWRIESESLRQSWGAASHRVAAGGSYLTDRPTTAETNKVESYNRFASWCRFGNAGVIADNDPEEQEKILKFSTLLTNVVIFHTTLT